MRIIWIGSIALALLAQAPPEPLQQPWDGVPDEFRKLPIGKLEIPKDLARWKAQRARIKSIVVNSLGEMPPRPAPSKVKVVNVDKKNGWRIVKFVFHNGVDSLVPGYIAIPEDGRQRHPAILT